jgi:hypothetical protein
MAALWGHRYKRLCLGTVWLPEAGSASLLVGQLLDNEILRGHVTPKGCAHKLLTGSVRRARGDRGLVG